MMFQFIDNQNSVTIIADNFQRVFPKNYLCVESDELSNILKIKSTEHRVLYVINFGTDTTVPSYPTKQDLINGLNFFFEVEVIGGGDMLKSVYDPDDNGIVDEAENITGTTDPLQYYGTDALNNKGFYDFPPAGLGDMQKSVYDTDNDGIVDASESISGITTPNQYYGSDAMNMKGFHNLPTHDLSGYMLKSVYDTNNDGINDSAASVSGTTISYQYYGTDASNTKGFFPLPNPIPAGQNISDNIIVKGSSNSTLYANLIYFIHNGYPFMNVKVLYYSQTGTTFTIDVFDVTNGVVIATLPLATSPTLVIENIPIINPPTLTQAVYTLRVKRNTSSAKTIFVESILIY